MAEPYGPQPRRAAARRSTILSGVGLVALVAVGSLAACDAGGPEPEDLDVPGLRVVAIEVTTRLIDEDDATPELVSAVIAPDGTTVATTGTSIRVRLNRFIDPSTATRQAICVQSATANVGSPADCIAGLLLRPSYDPVTRTVTYFLETDTTQLAPGTFYRITLFRSEGENDFGLRAFDGPALAAPVVLDLTTETPPGDPAPTESPDLGINFCNELQCLTVCGTRPDAEACSATCSGSVEEILGESCAFGGCHAPTKANAQAKLKAQEVPMGLDLTAAEGVSATAIARVAHGSQRGPGAQNPDVAGTAFGRSMPIIAPGDPGNSYLLYKLLANPAFHAPPPESQIIPGDLEPGETDRLRTSFVVGLPMPPSSQPVDSERNKLPLTNTPITQDRAILLSRWIAAGADTTRCGPPPLPVP